MGKILAAVLSMTLLLSACATQAPIRTASGKPEAVMIGSTKKQTADWLVNVMSSQGWDVTKTDEYSIAFSKRANDIATQLLFGSKFDATPEMRVRYNLIEQQSGIKVIATINVVTNPGSAFEKSQDFSDSGKLAVDIQNALESGAAQWQTVSSTRKRGRVGFGLNKLHEVTAVAPQSPADKAGVKIGDVLKSVDDKAFPSTPTDAALNLAVLSITGEVGTAGKYVFIRQGKEAEFQITRELLKD